MPKRRPDHQPQRTCAVCRTVRSKREMTRVVRTAEGGAVLDPTGRRAGRGTYVCSDPDCVASPRRAEAVARALGLSGPAAVDPAVVGADVTRASA